MTECLGTAIYCLIPTTGWLRRPDSWEDFFTLDAAIDVPADFMAEADRNQGEHGRDPFADAAS